MKDDHDALFDILIEIQEEAEKDGQKESMFPMTLNVHGMLVSGNLISKKAYFEKFQHGQIREALKKVQEQMSEEPKEAAGAERFQYIHLSDTKFFLPGQVPIPGNDQNVFWRGRLSNVDGFICGTLSALRE